jgi:hypothetical protein
LHDVKLTEDHKLRVREEIGGLRRIFGAQMQDLTGEWKTSHFEKMLNLHSSLHRTK